MKTVACGMGANMLAENQKNNLKKYGIVLSYLHVSYTLITKNIFARDISGKIEIQCKKNKIQNQIIFIGNYRQIIGKILETINTMIYRQIDGCERK